nr:type II secretion system F family protein [uncultured Peptostreptococcus sp.]
MKILLQKKIKDKELKVICQQIASMEKSGCDLMSIFDTIIKTSSKKVAGVMTMVKRNIERGRTMTEAFYLTNAFSVFFISMIRAGEISGNIDFVFEKMSAYYDREYRLKSKLLAAAIYPLILVFVTLISLIFILVFVVPNFESAFAIDMDQLPVARRSLFAVSRFLRANLLILIVFSTVLILFLIQMVKNSREIRSWYDEKKFEIPKLGRIHTMIISDNFSRAMAILLGSGVHIGESIEITTKLLDNRHLEKKMKLVGERIKKGNSVTRSLEIAGIFPQIFISMLMSGEESGNFARSMEMASIYYEKELDLELENLVKIVEPALIVVMGLIIGVCLYAILSPMFDMISNLG